MLNLAFLVFCSIVSTGTAEVVYQNWPFDATEAARRQAETSQMTKHPVVLQTSLDGKGSATVNWRLIPAGKFMIGSPATEGGHEGDERQRPETIAEPFYMMETQLTVEQYRALMRAEPSDSGGGSESTIPAGILFRDTVDKVLPTLAKFAPAGWKVILPDHVRLEYAARAGVATMNHGGDRPEDAAPYAWTRENADNRVHPVARKRPNAWGLHDVIGNRWHWFWRAGAGYGNDSTTNHIVYGGTYRAESGGNGARLANIMISDQAEGVRFALIRADAPLPKGHPETRQPAQDTGPLPTDLVLDLDADRGVTVGDGDRVSLWQNQVAGSVARDFVPRDQGRKTPGSGRPTLRKAIAELQGHSALVFLQQELVCLEEDAFDSLTQGGGCTWLAVLAVREQRVGLKDVNSFFGNLKNGGNYEGIWGNVSDDNKLWWGLRNGVTFGRFDTNNQRLFGLKLETGRFAIVAGRLAAGLGQVKLEVFVNSPDPVASLVVPANSEGNPSKMAVGQERDAIEHPGHESFDGEIARLLIFARLLEDTELQALMAALQGRYGIQGKPPSNGESNGAGAK